MTVVPFMPPAVKAELDEMLSRLASCEQALVVAGDAIKDLQARLETEKVMKVFYQDLATRRLSRIIELENNSGRSN